LPVELLAALAQREGRRPVPIYHAHRWFARRFSCVFRAILVALRTSPGQDFMERFYGGVDYTGLTVLDPFVGGGTSVVEAARLGASVLGVDIDPVACAITRFELHAADAPDLTPALTGLQQRVGRRLARYYRTAGVDGQERQILHAFWVQHVRCHRCAQMVEAHPHYQLAFEAEGDRQWAFCRACHRVQRLDRDAEAFRCPACKRQTVIAAGPVQHGRLVCPACHAVEDLIEVAERVNQPPLWHLFALETVPAGPAQRRVLMAGRAFQAATAADRDRVRAARRALAWRRGRGGWRWIPDRLIPAQGRSDDRLIQYGYRRYRELFNPRQLLHLSVLAEAIDALTGPTREALALAFSDHLTTNCMLTQYAFGWRRLAPLFSIRAYRHVTRPVEINPWLDGTGRGTFPNTVRQVQRAVEFAQAPEVAHLDGGFVRSGSLAVSGAGRVVHNADSRLLAEVADRSVDVILTDPPYCDNIAYSELSDFFLPWLRAFGLAPGAGNDRAVLPANLAARSREEPALAAFRQGLSECFAQLRRVLKDDGRFVFSYQHRTAGAWEALAAALAAGGWRPVQIFPLLGNSTAGLHQHEGTILWDAITVCRKDVPGTAPSDLRVSDRQVTAAVGHARRWADRLTAGKEVRFGGADHANLLRACLVAAALGTFGTRGRASGRPLLAVLEDLPATTN
jgi:adenine-specific DNA methylase